MVAVTKPVVNGSNGTWGTILNQALDDLVSAVNTNASSITTNSGNLTTLTNRVTTAENNIASLQTGSGFYSGNTAALGSDTHYSGGGHFYDTQTGYHYIGSSAAWVPLPGSLLVKVRQTVAQTLNDSTYTAINFGQIDYQRVTCWSGTTFTAPYAGIYEFTGAVGFNNVANGARLVGFNTPGQTSVIAGTGTQVAASSAVFMTVAARPYQASLAAGATMALYAYQTTGAQLNTASATSAALQPTCAVKYLGPA